MSAETLRRAAAELRDEWDDGRNPMGTAWHRERDFHLAVADLLDMHAQGLEDFNNRERFADKGAPYPEVQPNEKFLAVARAYLGGESVA